MVSCRHQNYNIQNDRFGFVIAGQNNQGQYLNDVYRYDAELDIWEQLSNFPGGTRGYAYGVSNEIYAFVGFGIMKVDILMISGDMT